MATEKEIEQLNARNQVHNTFSSGNLRDMHELMTNHPEYFGLKANQEDGTYLNPMSDEWYLNYIKKYENSPYYNELLNNPWLFQNNGGFSPTLLQDIGENLFNDFSARDKWTSEMISKRNQTMYDIIARLEQDKRNSPSAQVQANSLAGINSDLLGTGNVSPTAENDQPFTEFPSIGDSDSQLINTIQSVSSIPITLITSLLNIGSQFQSFEKNDLDMAMQELSNYSSGRELAFNMALDAMSSAVPYFSNLENSKIDDETLQKVLSDSLKEEYKKKRPYLSKRSSKFLDRFIDNFRVDRIQMQVARKKFENEWLKYHSDNADIMSKHGFNTDIDKMVRTISEDVSEPVHELESAIRDFNTQYYHTLSAKAKADAENARNQFDSDYYGTANGIEAGKTFNLEQEHKQGVYKFQDDLIHKYESIKKEVQDSFKRMESKFESIPPGKRTWYENAALMLLPTLQTSTEIALMKAVSALNIGVQ